jgi:LmbE family N-acetylglucosaminyl deacetylase
MIPVTAEATWLDSLRSASRWQPDAKNTIVVAPHPDDETLGAGGLIAAQRRRGIPVLIVAVTDGEAAYPDTPFLGPLRRIEQQWALAELGVDAGAIMRLRFPDSAVSQREAELITVLQSLVTRDTQLIAPWRHDPHPDHEACGRAAEQVARDTGALLVSYFFWTWHHHVSESLATLPLRRFELDPDLQAAKAAALAQHQSQLARPDGSPVLPEELLSPARRPFETFLLHD